jgi:Tfp pilus assembly protein PilN
MGSPSQLNFLPDDYLERKAQRRTNVACAMLFMVVMGGVGGAFYLDDQANRRIDRQHGKVEEQYVAEAKRLEQVKQMQEKQQRMFRQAALTASLLERIPRSYILAEITNALPSGASLLDLQLESKTRARQADPAAAKKTAYEQRRTARTPASAAAAPLPEPRSFDVHVKLTGTATSDELVARLMERLAQHDLFRDVNLPITQEHKMGAETVRKFQIELTLNPNAQVRPDDRTQTASTELKE